MNPVEKNLLIVGNIGPDTICIEGQEPERKLGGSLTRIAVVAASYEYPAVMFGTLRQENGQWEQLEPQLTQNRVNTSYVVPFRVGIEFEEIYDRDFALVDLLVRQSSMQGVAVALFQEYIRNLIESGVQDENFVTYICPLPPEMQEECVNAAREIGSVVALTTHFNLLESHHNLDTFKRILPKVDLLSLSSKEAQMITGEESPIEAGSKLSGFSKKGLVFVTCAEKGAYAFYGEEMIVQLRPDFQDRVIDVTGAGDVFFGATLVRMLQQGWDGETIDISMIVTAMEDAQRMVERKLKMFGFSEIIDPNELLSNNEDERSRVVETIFNCVC